MSNATQKNTQQSNSVTRLLSTNTFIIAFIISRCFFFDYTIVPSESMSNTIQTGDLVLFRKDMFRWSPIHIPVIGQWFFKKYIQTEEMTKRTRINLEQLDRGDIILWTDGNRNYIKRAIALPGDIVEFNRFDIRVNGQSLLFKDNKAELFEQPVETIMTHDNGKQETVKRYTCCLNMKRGGSMKFHVYYSPSQINYNISYTKIIVPDDQVFIRGDNRDHSFDSINGMKVPIRGINGRALLSIFGSVNRFQNTSWLMLPFKYLAGFRIRMTPLYRKHSTHADC